MSRLYVKPAVLASSVLALSLDKTALPSVDFRDTAMKTAYVKVQNAENGASSPPATRIVSLGCSHFISGLDAELLLAI